jgi:hypothetical protein
MVTEICWLDVRAVEHLVEHLEDGRPECTSIFFYVSGNISAYFRIRLSKTFATEYVLYSYILQTDQLSEKLPTKTAVIKLDPKLVCYVLPECNIHTTKT